MTERIGSGDDLPQLSENIASTVEVCQSMADSVHVEPDFQRILEGLKNDKSIAEQLSQQERHPKPQLYENATTSSNIDSIRKKLIQPSNFLAKNFLLKKEIRRITKQLTLEREKLNALQNQFQHRVQRAVFQYMKSKRKVQPKKSKKQPST